MLLAFVEIHIPGTRRRLRYQHLENGLIPINCP